MKTHWQPHWPVFFVLDHFVEAVHCLPKLGEQIYPATLILKKHIITGPIYIQHAITPIAWCNQINTPCKWNYSPNSGLKLEDTLAESYFQCKFGQLMILDGGIPGYIYIYIHMNQTWDLNSNWGAMLMISPAGQILRARLLWSTLASRSGWLPQMSLRPGYGIGQPMLES